MSQPSRPDGRRLPAPPALSIVTLGAGWPGDIPRLATDREPACAQCGGPWRELGHCKGVCLTCGFMQSCVDTL